MFVNDYWVTGTPTKEEIRYLDESVTERGFYKSPIHIRLMWSSVVSLIVCFVCIAVTDSFSSPLAITAIIWLACNTLSLFVSTIYVAKVVLPRADAFLASPRVHNFREYIADVPMYYLHAALGGNQRNLMSRHKEYVDAYLLDYEVNRLAELMDRKNPAPTSSQKLRMMSALKAKAASTAATIRQLDAPHKRAKQQADAEQVHLAQLKADADREVLDWEINQALGTPNEQ